MRRDDVYRNLVQWQQGLADRGWNSLYWTNHDQPRTVSRFGDDAPEHWANSAKTLASVIYLMKGTAFIYQGDEIGMINMPFASLDDFDDISAVEYIRADLARGRDPQELLQNLARTSRDNARTPMQWSSGAGAGFTDAVPWLPVNPSASWLSVQAQRDDPHSVLSHMRAVIAARRDLPALAAGDFIDLDTGDVRLIAYDRVEGDHRVRVLANLSSDAVALTAFEMDALIEVAPLRVGQASATSLGPWASRAWSTDDLWRIALSP
jgi:oligo-1,6-glucosidase